MLIRNVVCALIAAASRKFAKQNNIHEIPKNLCVQGLGN